MLAQDNEQELKQTLPRPIYFGTVRKGATRRGSRTHAEHRTEAEVIIYSCMLLNTYIILGKDES